MDSPQSSLHSTVRKWLVSLDLEAATNPSTGATSPPPSEDSDQSTYTQQSMKHQIEGCSCSSPCNCNAFLAWGTDMPTTPPSTASKAASGGSRGSGSPSQKRAASPSKRRRVESEAEGEREPEPEPDDDLPPSARTQDPDKTPMPSTKTDALRQQYGRISLQPSQRPILRPSSPGKRSSSPVKAMRDLQRLQKPVRFAQLPSLGRRRKEVLPADVHKIVHEISSRTVGGFIPGILKEEFARMLECDLDDIPAVWFRDDGEASEGSKAEVDKAVLLRELYGLKAILRSAIESAELRRSEPAWNAKVHQPILDLAFGDGLWRDADEQGAWPEGEAESRRVGAEYVATATLTGDCIPRLRAQYKSGPVQEETASDTSSVLACSATSSSDSTASGFLDEDVFGNIQDMPRARKVHDGTVHSRAGSKKVDFALVITPGRGTRLAQAIDEMIDRLDAQGLANLDAGRPQPSLSINPTQYEPLQRRPIASIIETKIVPDPQDPQVLLQLGFMVAALHKRMTGFLMHSHPPSYITVPIISVVCHDWTLHFACDRQSHIELMGPLFLGSTKSMEDIYKLVACLRALQAWILEEYCPWLLRWLSEPA